MELKDLVLKRQSCRNYDKERTPQLSDVSEAIKIALKAPSACNSQPWSLTVVNGELAPKVGKCCREFGGNKFTENVNTYIVITEEKPNLPERVGSIVKDNAFAEIDIGIMTGHLILALEERGLSSCIMGLFKEKELKELLDINKNKRIRLVLSVGYKNADDPIREKVRKPLEKTVKFIE